MSNSYNITVAPGTEKGYGKMTDDNQIAQQGIGNEQPDAVSLWGKLFLKEKILVLCGPFCSREERVYLDNIVRVVDEQGHVGRTFTKTFYPESLKIETYTDNLDIGSTQHDYYDYMDPGSFFKIITKSEQYIAYKYDEHEANTVWNWIVNYFEQKKV